MNKLVLAFLMLFISNNIFANTVYLCSSDDTKLSYRFDVIAGTVDVKTESGESFGFAEVTYEPGKGDDVLYFIKQGGLQFGVLNGEEGTIRANFSHSIFERNIEEEGIECVDMRDLTR